MTDVLKVLGQVAPTDTSANTLYTVPSLASTTTSSLVVCNLTAGSLTFSVAIRPAGITPIANKHYLFYATPLAGNSTLTAVLGMTLAETDVVTVYASATGLSFTLFGVETT